MRTLPDDDSDLADLNAAPWMIDALRMNPDYIFWGPDEDYMSSDEGWRSPIRVDSWSGRPSLDDLNEVVNFYFEIRRESKKCPDCETGYSPTARRFMDQWYGISSFDVAAYGATPVAADHLAITAIITLAKQNVGNNPGCYGRGPSAVSDETLRLYRDCFAGSWSHHLIQADVDALVAAGRLRDLTRRPINDEQVAALKAQEDAGGSGFWLAGSNGHHPTAAEVNAWSIGGMGHDAINASVCVRARCEREGVSVECATCGGASYIYTAPTAHLALVAWLIHPRKGASRGVEIKRIEEHEMPAALRWLTEAATRNAGRFAKVQAAAHADEINARALEQ